MSFLFGSKGGEPAPDVGSCDGAVASGGLSKIAIPGVSEGVAYALFGVRKPDVVAFESRLVGEATKLPGCRRGLFGGIGGDAPDPDLLGSCKTPGARRAGMFGMETNRNCG